MHTDTLEEVRPDKARSAHPAGIAILLCTLLTACGGGGGGDSASTNSVSVSSSTPSTYKVGGTISGLAGLGLTLRNNGADDLNASSNGTFVFNTALASGSSYSVTVATQPSLPTQNCAVGNASGAVGSANITAVTISCVTVPLTLTSSVPASSASGVARTATMALTFSTPLNAATVTTTNVSLQGPSGVVAIAVSASNNVLTVTPTSPLSPNATYTLTVSTAVRGTNGEAPASAVTFGFTTAAIAWTSLIGRTWTVSASNEAYKCTRIVAPSDLYITGFRTTANKVVRAMLTVSSSATVTGDYNCNSASLDNALIYASGLGTGDFVFPAGFGIKVLAGQFLNLNLHIVNATTATVTDTAEILVQSGIAADVTTPAEMILLGTRLLSIPNNGSVVTASGGYTATQEQQLLALLPLMQTYATHQKVVVRRPSITDTILDVDFNPTIQSFYPLTPVSIHAGDRPLASCSYINNGAQTITFGDSWDQETCYSGMYLAPSFGQTWSVGTL